MVKIAPTGDGHQKTQTWHRVEKLRPPKNLSDRDRAAPTYMAMEARWTVIGPAYEAWRSGQDMPENGTPLAAWAGVTGEQAAFLKNMGIRTVEDVRDMSESAFTKLPFPNARKLPGLAAEYLKGEEVADKDRQLSEMRERMEAMEAMLEAQAEAPKKRGRPKKEAA